MTDWQSSIIFLVLAVWPSTDLHPRHHRNFWAFTRPRMDFKADLGDINSLVHGRSVCDFQPCFTHWYIQIFLWKNPQENASAPYWWLVNIVSGNGLVQSGNDGNKPSPEPVLTKISWCHVVSLGLNEFNMLTYRNFTSPTDFSAVNVRGQVKFCSVDLPYIIGITLYFCMTMTMVMLRTEQKILRTFHRPYFQAHFLKWKRFYFN